MGNDVSKNVVNSISSVSNSVVTNSFQDCSTTVSSIQQISLDGCTDVDLEDIAMRQVVSLEGGCASANKVNTDISTNMDAAIQQQADSVSQMFQLSSAESDNVTNITQELSTAVAESFSQNCASTLDNRQIISCSNSSGVFVKRVDFDQTIQATLSCIQNNESITKLTNELSTAISQTASAKTEGLFSWLSNLIMLIIIGCVALLVLKFVFQKRGGGGGASARVPTVPYSTGEIVGISVSMPVLAMSTALTVGFLVTTFANTTIWPYTRKIPNKKPPAGEEQSDGSKQAIASNDARNKKNANTNVIIFVVALAVDAATIATIYLCYRHHKLRALGKIKPANRAAIVPSPPPSVVLPVAAALPVPVVAAALPVAAAVPVPVVAASSVAEQARASSLYAKTG